MARRIVRHRRAGRRVSFYPVKFAPPAEPKTSSMCENHACREEAVGGFQYNPGQPVGRYCLQHGEALVNCSGGSFSLGPGESKHFQR